MHNQNWSQNLNYVIHVWVLSRKNEVKNYFKHPGLRSWRISALITSDSETISAVSVLIQQCTLPKNLWTVLKNQFFRAAKSALFQRWFPLNQNCFSADFIWKSSEQRWFFVDSRWHFSVQFLFFFSKQFEVLLFRGTKF